MAKALFRAATAKREMPNPIRKPQDVMPDAQLARVSLDVLQRDVIACTRCPRLIRYCRRVAREKRRMYRNQEYWGRPIPSFGDPEAELLILGLGPAAHGGNRTGRMFTGDRSGDFLFRALYETGFANQPLSVERDDGLQLHRCYITAALRCAPPENKPKPEELRNCRPYLVQEIHLLKRTVAVLTLGRIAFDSYLSIIYGEYSSRNRHLRDSRPSGPKGAGPETSPALPLRSSLQFAHGVSFVLPGGLPRLFASYHPSQQNTQTGKLTPQMFREVLEEVRTFLDSRQT
jgi:uracil-DNA glycosylase